MRFTKPHLTSPLFAALFAVAIAPLAQPAMAQTNQAPAPSMQQAAPEINLSTQKVQQYVQAQENVAAINDKWSQKLAQMPTEKQNEAAQQMNDEMVSAVRDSGLTVSEFNQIALAVRQSPELQQKIIQQLQ